MAQLDTAGTSRITLANHHELLTFSLIRQNESEAFGSDERRQVIRSDQDNIRTTTMNRIVLGGRNARLDDHEKCDAQDGSVAHVRSCQKRVTQREAVSRRRPRSGAKLMALLKSPLRIANPAHQQRE